MCRKYKVYAPKRHLFLNAYAELPNLVVKQEKEEQSGFKHFSKT